MLLCKLNLQLPYNLSCFHKYLPNDTHFSCKIHRGLWEKYENVNFLCIPKLFLKISYRASLRVIHSVPLDMGVPPTIFCPDVWLAVCLSIYICIYNKSLCLIYLLPFLYRIRPKGSKFYVGLEDNLFWIRFDFWEEMCFNYLICVIVSFIPNFCPIICRLIAKYIDSRWFVNSTQ